MTHTAIERDFLRFRATGDPDALGRVFDAVAPRLLLVAAHLAPADAEDLVQATFVSDPGPSRGANARWRPCSDP